MNLSHDQAVPSRVPPWILVAVGVALPVVVALAHGIGRPYTTTPDADLLYVGEALRALDGRPYSYTDHPGYTYTLLLAAWMKLLGLAGLIPRPGLGAAIAAPSIDAYMQAMVWAGRLFSALSGSALVAAAAALVRKGGASALATGLFALLLGSSAGMVYQALILRAELLSGGLAFVAFLCLGVAARRSGWTPMIWLATAGWLAILAMFAKVQAIFVLLALPGSALFLAGLQGARPPALAADWRGLPVILALVAVTLPMLVVIPASMAEFGAGKPYQLVIVVWVALGMTGFAVANKVPPGVALLAGLALAAGMALGFDLILLRQSPRVLDAVVNPVEHMSAFSAVAQAGERAPALAAVMDRMFSGVSLRARHLLPLHLMQLAALAGAVLCLRRRRVRPALLAAALAGTAIVVEALFQLRGVFSYYLIYLEPWPLLGLVVALENGARPRLMVAAAAALIVWQSVEAFDSSLVPVQPIGNVCNQADGYLEPQLAVRFHPLCGR